VREGTLPELPALLALVIDGKLLSGPVLVDLLPESPPLVLGRGSKSTR